MNAHLQMVDPSSRAAARRDRAFFCIVGTLLAMAVVVYQGDYSGYKAALAESSAVADKPSPTSLLPPRTQIGYRTTPASGDPYRYIRTGNYARILNAEAQVQRNAWTGIQPATPHALNLLDCSHPGCPPAAAAVAGSEVKGKVETAQAAVGAAIAPAAFVTQPLHALNVAGVKWAHVKEPGDNSSPKKAAAAFVKHGMDQESEWA